VFCVKCGKKLPDGSSFCPHCGASAEGSRSDRHKARSRGDAPRHIEVRKVRVRTDAAADRRRTAPEAAPAKPDAVAAAPASAPTGSRTIGFAPAPASLDGGAPLTAPAARGESAPERRPAPAAAPERSAHGFAPAPASLDGSAPEGISAPAAAPEARPHTAAPAPSHERSARGFAPAPASLDGGVPEGISAPAAAPEARPHTAAPAPSHERSARGFAPAPASLDGSAPEGISAPAAAPEARPHTAAPAPSHERSARGFAPAPASLDGSAPEGISAPAAAPGSRPASAAPGGRLRGFAPAPSGLGEEPAREIPESRPASAAPGGRPRGFAPAPSGLGGEPAREIPESRPASFGFDEELPTAPERRARGFAPAPSGMDGAIPVSAPVRDASDRTPFRGDAPAASPVRPSPIRGRSEEDKYERTMPFNEIRDEIPRGRTGGRRSADSGYIGSGSSSSSGLPETGSKTGGSTKLYLLIGAGVLAALAVAAFFIFGSCGGSAKGSNGKAFTTDYVVEDYHNGCFIVAKGKHGPYGALNVKGKEVLPVEYDSLEFSSDRNDKQNFLYASLDGRCGVFDLTGKEIIPMEYKFVEQFHDECLLTYAHKSTPDYDVFNSEGELLTTISEGGDRVLDFLGKEYIIVFDSNGDIVRDSGYKVIDYSGNVVFSEDFGEAYISVSGAHPIVLDGSVSTIQYSNLETGGLMHVVITEDLVRSYWENTWDEMKAGYTFNDIDMSADVYQGYYFINTVARSGVTAMVDGSTGLVVREMTDETIDSDTDFLEEVVFSVNYDGQFCTISPKGDITNLGIDCSSRWIAMGTKLTYHRGDTWFIVDKDGNSVVDEDLFNMGKTGTKANFYTYENREGEMCVYSPDGRRVMPYGELSVKDGRDLILDGRKVDDVFSSFDAICFAINNEDGSQTIYWYGND